VTVACTKEETHSLQQCSTYELLPEEMDDAGARSWRNRKSHGQVAGGDGPRSSAVQRCGCGQEPKNLMVNGCSREKGVPKGDGGPPSREGHRHDRKAADRIAQRQAHMRVDIPEPGRLSHREADDPVEPTTRYNSKATSRRKIVDGGHTKTRLREKDGGAAPVALEGPYKKNSQNYHEDDVGRKVTMEGK